MAVVFHGCAAYQVPQLLSGTTATPGGLSVTDTAPRAQLYADAQATRAVCDALRYAPGSAVVELESNESLHWFYRPACHNTLDVAEAKVRTWNIVRVVVYATAFDTRASVVMIGGKWVKLYSYLREQLGDMLHIVVVTDTN